MTALWTSKEVAVATGGQSLGEWDVDGVCIDSRSVAVGDLFIALGGPRFDGHDFVVEALERGASAAMVSRIPGNSKQTIDEDRLVMVGDTFDGLRALASAARARAAGKVAAVTGSVGKTTTKDALALVLGRQGQTHATTGNLNNQWGAPLTLSRMPAETRFGVIELGMNHAGEIEPLAHIVRPNVAIVTAVEAMHLEFFKSVAEIADAKAEIFAGLEPEGTAIVPADNTFHDQLASAAREAGAAMIVSFGTDKSAAYRLIAWTVTETGTRIVADVNGHRLVFEVGLCGKHMALNSLAVLATVSALGGDAEKAAGDLYDMAPPKGRGARNVIELGLGSFVVIDESYNASPASVGALIDSLSAMRRTGRLILALGDMLELGQDSHSMHADLAVPISAAGIDAVFTAGRQMAYLHDAIPSDIETTHADDSVTLATLLTAAVKPGDIIAVKGSFGSHMNVIVSALEELGIGYQGTSQNVVNGD